MTGEKKLFDKLCLKRTVAEESKDYAAAVKSLLEALDLLEKQSVSDPDKGKLAIAYEALCSACLHLKNDKEAEQYGLMALALKKDVYWEWHFELFNTECLLGTIYTRLNKRDAALQHYSHARRIIAEKPDGVETFRKIWLCCQLAELYFSINQQTEFEESLRELVYLIEIHSAHTNNLGELYTILAVMAETYDKDVMRSFLPKMKEQADKGNPDALFAMGLWYSIGGVFRKEPDTKTSNEYLLRAAKQGHSRAQYVLGLRYARGEGIVKNMSEAAKWYYKAVGSRWGEVQLVKEYNWGLTYTNSGGVFMCDAETVKRLRKTAEQGNAEAQYNLGVAYLNGDGIASDVSEAVKWYRKAAEQGYAKAQYNLGCCYANGEGITENIFEAMKWYRKAMEQGLVELQFWLGYCYANGVGVAKDMSEAVKWYRKAAEQGHAKAQYNLGCCYDKDGIASDMSCCYMMTSQEKREIESLGINVFWRFPSANYDDMSEAVKWWYKAAEQGCAKAQYNLGLCYVYRMGITGDIQDRVKWFRKAAEQGNADAQLCLGICYAEGDGVAKDMSEAVKWCRKAAEQGHEDAKRALSYLEK